MERSGMTWANGNSEPSQGMICPAGQKSIAGLLGEIAPKIFEYFEYIV
jgi:hypothetical protein